MYTRPPWPTPGRRYRPSLAWVEASQHRHRRGAATAEPDQPTYVTGGAAQRRATTRRRNRAIRRSETRHRARLARQMDRARPPTRSRTRRERCHRCVHAAPSVVAAQRPSAAANHRPKPQAPFAPPRPHGYNQPILCVARVREPWCCPCSSASWCPMRAGRHSASRRRFLHTLQKTTHDQIIPYEPPILCSSWRDADPDLHLAALICRFS